MKILSIDTAHGVCSVALSDNDKIIYTQTDNEPSKQAERLFITIDKILQQSNCTYSDMNAIACDIGPGSFTGVRIGLSAARGIALAANIPVIGISGLEALAQEAYKNTDCKELLVTFNARRGQVFAQFFSNNEVGQPLLLEYKEIIKALPQHNPITLIGDGTSLIEQSLRDNNIKYRIIEDYLLPSASIIAFCAFKMFSQGDYNSNPTPLYIRPPDAKLPNKK